MKISKEEIDSLKDRRVLTSNSSQNLRILRDLGYFRGYKVDDYLQDIELLKSTGVVYNIDGTLECLLEAGLIKKDEFIKRKRKEYFFHFVLGSIIHVLGGIFLFYNHSDLSLIVIFLGSFCFMIIKILWSNFEAKILVEKTREIVQD